MKFLLFPSVSVAILVLALAGCGFAPVYGTHDNTGTPVAEQLSLVGIDSIKDREGQEMRNYLIDRMYGKSGRPQKPLYRLTVKIHYAESDVGVLENATSTLAVLDNFADYTLTDMKGKQLLAGTAHSATQYSQLNSQYATLTAHDSAVDRTTHELSEQIVNRLGAYFAEGPLPKHSDEAVDRPD